MCGSGVRIPGTTIMKEHQRMVELGLAVVSNGNEFCAGAPGPAVQAIAGLLFASTTIQLFASTFMGSDWPGTNPLLLLPFSCCSSKEGA